MSPSLGLSARLLLCAAFALMIAIFASPAAQAQTRIVNGTQINDFDTSWPFLVSVTINNSSFCGGTLIAPQVVLTASHCIVNDGGVAATAANVKVYTGSATLADQAEHAVATVIAHPSYDPDTTDNDITVLVLSTPATGSAKPIWPVQAGEASMWAAGASLNIGGWGLLSTDHPDGVQEIARQATVPSIADATCAPNIGAGFHAVNMMCAGILSEVSGGGVDTCQGDSGGPLLARGDNLLHTRLVGITSWGFDCGGANYGVYARVDALRPWANEQLAALPQPVTATGPVIAGTPVVGTPVSCTAGAYTGQAAAVAETTLLRNDASINNPGPYTIAAGDAGATFKCRDTVLHNYGRFDAVSALAVGPVAGAPAPETDVCSNIEGNQATVPPGYTAAGTVCTQTPTPTTDACSNIEGNQASVPSGMTATGGVCTTPVNPDLCPNIEGTQTSQPAGTTMVNGNCVANGEAPLDLTGVWPILQMVPNIQGTRQVGQKLTCSPGLWLAGSTYSYRWTRSSTTVVGQTNSYRLRAADVQKRVACIVTATGPYGVRSFDVTAGRIVRAPSVLTMRVRSNGVAALECGASVDMPCELRPRATVTGSLKALGSPRYVDVQVDRRVRIKGVLRWQRAGIGHVLVTARGGWAMALPQVKGGTYRVRATFAGNGASDSSTGRMYYHIS